MRTAEKYLSSFSPLVNITSDNIALFRLKVDKNGPLPDQSNPQYHGLGRCYQWTGSKDHHGYGRMRCGNRATGAHRVAYFLSYGEPPQDRPFVLHKCDNASCCNPDHLFVGTHSENMIDKHKKGRANMPSGELHYAKTNPKPRRCGESNGMAKLTANDVIEIRKIRESGMPYKKIAPMFGVDFTVIASIAKRKTWKHVP